MRSNSARCARFCRTVHIRVCALTYAFRVIDLMRGKDSTGRVVVYGRSVSALQELRFKEPQRQRSVSALVAEGQAPKLAKLLGNVTQGLWHEPFMLRCILWTASTHSTRWSRVEDNVGAFKYEEVKCAVGVGARTGRATSAQPNEPVTPHISRHWRWTESSHLTRTPASDKLLASCFSSAKMSIDFETIAPAPRNEEVRPEPTELLHH